MTLPLRVRIGNWVAVGDDEDLVNREGFVIAPSGFTGWDDGVDMRRDNVNRPRAAGSFETQGFPDSRVVSLSGSCWATTPQKLDWFKKQLTGLLSDGLLGTVTIDHQGSTLYASGARASRPSFTVTGADDRDALWQLQLWFPDPRKYGELRTFGPAETVEAHHYGNTDAYPVFTVAGSMASGYTIEGPGGLEFTVTEPVTSGHPHTIDMSTGYLMVDGAIVHGEVTSAGTWAVPAGETVSQTLDPVSGSGTLTVAVKDTYL